MKILITSDLYYPTINGVATFSRNLAKGLADRGHEVVVIAPSQRGKKHDEVDGNYLIKRTTAVPFPFYQNLKVSLSPNREVKRIIEDFNPDVIHIQLMLTLGAATMRYGNKFGIPIVSTNHAMPENLIDNLKLLAPFSRPISYMLQAYGTRFHSKADFVTLPTQAAIDMYSAYEKMTIPMKAISNGIDLQRFQPGSPAIDLYRKFDLDPDRPIVSYVGRIDGEKHLSVLVRAFDIVRREVPEAQLLLVGDGVDVANLKVLINELELTEAVRFTGRVSDEDITELHRVGTVFCMPSPAELQSIATLEAMSSGQPVVAVDAGALKELCQDGRNGYLCPKDDDQAIANGLIKILTDADLRQKFSEQSLVIARTHDLNTSLDAFEEIYRDLTNA